MASPSVRVERRAWLGTQSAFDTYTAWAGADAIGFLSLEITPNKVFLDSNEQQGTASHIGFVEDKQSVSWSLEAELKHTDGGTPELDELFQEMWGTASGTGARSYTLNNNTPGSLQIAKTDEDGVFQQVSGAIVTEWEISNEGGSIATVRASGVGASYDEIRGEPTIDATLSASATTITVTAADVNQIRFDRGLLVQFGTDDNSGSGYTVTGYNTSTRTLTFTPGAAVGASSGDTIAPVMPTASYSGTRIGAIASQATINSLAMGFTSATIKGSTGYNLLDAEASTDRPNRAERGPRRISAEISMYLLDENGTLNGLSMLGTQVSHAIRIGSSSGPSITLTMPAARIQSHNVVPGNDDAPTIYTFESFATRSAADNDELGVSAS